MKKLLSITLLSVFLLTFAFATVLAQVEGPKEGCVIKESMKAGAWEIKIRPGVNDLYEHGGAQVDPDPDMLWLYKGATALLSGTGEALEGWTEDFDGVDTKLDTTPVYIATENLDSDMSLSAALAEGLIIAGPNEFHIPQTAKAAQSGIRVDESDTLPPNWGVFCLLGTIDTVVDWIFIFLIAVSVALIAIAGFMYMTAAGNPEQQKKAGGMIMGAVIGIVIALLARLVPALITGILV